ncbi:MAG: extracellular solute-binding protein [Treponema sp.]|jgi:ABC-type glycerol-3-phosphate transport system substrate-binding protein|nr:extracellular solute-binding protein [Treponema sp.]
MMKKLFFGTVFLAAVFGMVFAGGTKQQGVSGEAGEKVTLRVVDWSDSNKVRRDAFHQEFMAKHPNINIEYSMMTIDQFRNTALTAIQSGDAPDLFPVPSGMKLAMAVSENWYTPLDGYVTQEFLNTIDPAYMADGYQKLNGKFYVFTEWGVTSSALVYYNKDILAEAGLDPAKIKTHADFRDACKKITQAGKGRYYGIIEGGNQLGRWETTARGWAGVAGGRAGRDNEVMVVNGRSIFDTPEMIGVVNLFRGIAQDGSFHPDTVSISAPEARARFAQGAAGFLVQGIWCITVWENDNPDFHFGVLPIPSPTATVKGSIPRGTPGPWMGISSGSKHPEAAGRYLMELFGESYQGACVAAGGNVSIVKGINEKYMPPGATREYYDAAVSQQRMAPDAMVIEPKVTDFYAQVRDIQPSLAAIMQGAVAGSIADIPGALKALSDKATAEWDRTAKAIGIPLSTFEFRNWDPVKDYTSDMYQGR